MSDDLVKQALAELGDVVRCRCHEAYTGRGMHDPDCQCDSAEAVKVVAERIEELEAKLEALDHAYDSIVQALRFEALRTDDAESKLYECEARLEKAVVTLAWCARHEESEHARATLAELKGKDT